MINWNTLEEKKKQEKIIRNSTLILNFWPVYFWIFFEISNYIITLVLKLWLSPSTH